jgi:hypothetical protein
MHDQTDQLIVAIALLLPAAARATAILTAAAVGLWSRHARRRADARELIRTMQGRLPDRPSDDDRPARDHSKS